MPAASGRRVDTFVVRVWRDGPADRWLRLDVEHVHANAREVRRWPRDGDDDQTAGGWLVRCIEDATTREVPNDDGHE